MQTLWAVLIIGLLVGVLCLTGNTDVAAILMLGTFAYSIRRGLREI